VGRGGAARARCLRTSPDRGAGEEEMPDERTREVQFVTKVSKLCNLRCRYCYEFAELGRRERMGRDQLRRMYTHIRDYYVRRDEQDGCRTTVTIVWHGGEPLLIEPAFYRRTFEDQREIFGGALRVENTLQTNLTVLDEERVRLLREGFGAIGVSVDLFGGLRVNIAGRDRQSVVIDNMERLRREGIPFGCITVLTRANLHRVREVFRFYERADLGFRVLPLFEGAYAGQHGSYEITVPEIVRALTEIADLWLASENPVRVAPLDAQFRTIMRHLDPGAPRVYYDQRAWLPVIVVDTPGDIYAYGDPYEDPQWSLGDIFTTPLDAMLSGERFEASARAADVRMAANCLNCTFFGACSGGPIAANRDNVHTLAEGVAVCDVERQVLNHLEARVRDSGLLDTLRQTTDSTPTIQPVS
jgi:uncharacterized protein